jgi:transposase-like protein
MARKAHKIAPEVKQEILRRIKEEGVAVSQAAKEHGISDATIYSWLGKGVRGAPSFAELVKLKRENRELLELVGELTVKLSHTQKKN